MIGVEFKDPPSLSRVRQLQAAGRYGVVSRNAPASGHERPAGDRLEAAIKQGRGIEA
jgi:hypothetical protein